MNKNQKTILILIITILLIIIILISLLFLNKAKNKSDGTKAEAINDNNSIINIEYQDESNVRIEYEYEPINNSTTFFTIKSCIERYINNIIDKNYNKVYDLLDKEYINNNNITIDNIINKIDKYNKNEQIIISQMYELKGNNIEKYSIKYYIINKNNGEKETQYAVVTVNRNDFSFSITPIKDKVSSIKNIKLDVNKESIENNNNNQYEYLRYTEEKIAREYYEYYNMLLIYVPEDAY